MRKFDDPLVAEHQRDQLLGNGVIKRAITIDVFRKRQGRRQRHVIRQLISTSAQA